MFRSIGGPEIIIILIVVLIIFGPKQLPKLGKMFGKTVKEVRSSMDEIKEDEAPKEDAAKAATEDAKSEDKAE